MKLGAPVPDLFSLVGTGRHTFRNAVMRTPDEHQQKVDFGAWKKSKA